MAPDAQGTFAMLATGCTPTARSLHRFVASREGALRGTDLAHSRLTLVRRHRARVPRHLQAGKDLHVARKAADLGLGKTFFPICVREVFPLRRKRIARFLL